MNWRAYGDEPSLRAFAALEDGGLRILARRGYESWASAMAASDDAAAAERTVSGGRAQHPVVALPDGGSAVLRRYRRGGLMRHLNRDRYFRGHRAFEELRVTERAGASGVRVPEVLAAAERRRRVGYGAMLATRLIEGASGLDRWLADRPPAERTAALRAVGEQIGRMHTAGIAHPDLNLRNLLIVPAREGGDAEAYLIDFDRARLSDAPVEAARRAAELQRFARSATKLGVGLGAAEWAALRSGYGPAWPRSSGVP